MSPSAEREVWAVIVAGGSSRRMGFDKLTAPLAGRPVLAWTLAAFAACDDIAGIILVSPADRREEFESLARTAAPALLRSVVAGGAHRHLSVARGLEAVPPQAPLIAVHDAARPLVTPALIARCAAAARRDGAASCARPVGDTLKRADAEGRVIAGVERDGLWTVETPQIFRADLLREAYRRLLGAGGHATDETSAVQALGAPVRLIDSGAPNLKITWPADLDLARLVMQARGGK